MFRIRSIGLQSSALWLLTCFRQNWGLVRVVQNIYGNGEILCGLNTFSKEIISSKCLPITTNTKILQ